MLLCSGFIVQLIESTVSRVKRWSRTPASLRHFIKCRNAYNDAQLASYEVDLYPSARKQEKCTPTAIRFSPCSEKRIILNGFFWRREALRRKTLEVLRWERDYSIVITARRWHCRLSCDDKMRRMARVGKSEQNTIYALVLMSTDSFIVAIIVEIRLYRAWG